MGRPAATTRDASLSGVLPPPESPQQKDNLCGPFWAARILREFGITTWDGEQIDDDLIALRAGSVLPDTDHDGDLPPGAVSRTSYRYELAKVPAEESGTASGSLATAIEAAAAGALRYLPLRGDWTAERVEGLLDGAGQLGDARLIANVRTGRLWGSRPPLAVLLAELEGRSVPDPTPDWDVGHFVELGELIRGSGGSLVVVRDTYPTLGLMGYHLQPPRMLAAALERGDGREGGVLLVVAAEHAGGVHDLAHRVGLDIGAWNNGTRI